MALPEVKVNKIHPTAIVDDGVELGDGNEIGAYAIVHSGTVIGDGNWIGSGTVIGALPEVRSVTHVGSGASSLPVRIGDRNVLREQVLVQAGWQDATTIGDDTFLMGQAYIAHDVALASGVTLASGVRLAGHVHIDRLANIGMGTVVHQRRHVGAWTMVGMGSVVTRDIPPGSLAFGNPCRARGLNRVGLERAGIGVRDVEALENWLSGSSTRLEVDNSELRLAVTQWKGGA